MSGTLASKLAAFAADPGPLPPDVVDAARQWNEVSAPTRGPDRTFPGDDPEDVAFRAAVAAFTPDAADPVGHTMRAVVVPALRVSGGGQAIPALAVAAEVTARLLTVMGAALTARGAPVYSVLGPLGAAVAVAKAGGGGGTEIANALAVACSLACGVAETGGAYLAGWAARSGVLAGRLGLGGFTGPAEALEGRRGLFVAFAGGVSDAALVERLGEHWRLLDVR